MPMTHEFAQSTSLQCASKKGRVFGSGIGMGSPLLAAEKTKILLVFDHLDLEHLVHLAPAPANLVSILGSLQLGH
jgi:hypothetical protein